MTSDLANLETPGAVSKGLVERHEHGVTILSPIGRKPFRRVLYVNLYGGTTIWKQIKGGLLPPHHLWGCQELVRRGYEVALGNAVWNFDFRRPLPHDLSLFSLARHWLRPDDIVYCAHNVLFWIPLLKGLRVVAPHLVSLLYAREPLDFSGQHSGIAALTPPAVAHARKLSHRPAVAHLPWGADLDFFPELPYRPEWFLACGITHRDHHTLSKAAAKSRALFRLICPGRPAGVTWSANVEVIDGGLGWNFQKEAVSYGMLLNDYYAGCAASLIILTRDDRESTACGFTNMLEAMAMARPMIVTRTGAAAREIDVESLECGLFVPPEAPDALSEAIEWLAANPAEARRMGQNGLRLARERYNIGRYSSGLHDLFESL